MVCVHVRCSRLTRSKLQKLLDVPLIPWLAARSAKITLAPMELRDDWREVYGTAPQVFHTWVEALFTPPVFFTPRLGVADLGPRQTHRLRDVAPSLLFTELRYIMDVQPYRYQRPCFMYDTSMTLGESPETYGGASSNPIHPDQLSPQVTWVVVCIVTKMRTPHLPRRTGCFNPVRKHTFRRLAHLKRQHISE